MEKLPIRLRKVTKKLALGYKIGAKFKKLTQKYWNWRKIIQIGAKLYKLAQNHKNHKARYSTCKRKITENYKKNHGKCKKLKKIGAKLRKIGANLQKLAKNYERMAQNNEKLAQK